MAASLLDQPHHRAQYRRMGDDGPLRLAGLDHIGLNQHPLPRLNVAADATQKRHSAADGNLCFHGVIV